MFKKLSGRAERALEILNAGGRFRYALERKFHGRDQFHMRLLNAHGDVVSGIGFATKIELEKAGLLKYHHPHDSRSSAWPSEWVVY